MNGYERLTVTLVAIETGRTLLCAVYGVQSYQDIVEHDRELQEQLIGDVMYDGINRVER